jgi:hypothetical protein
MQKKRLYLVNLPTLLEQTNSSMRILFPVQVRILGDWRDALDGPAWPKMSLGHQVAAGAPQDHPRWH